ncbi:hypothetical protein HZH68_008088 [Vespula germanica]|uniref:Uncharacterized protein n=1 Tax=Vespula germanica TaxID=30212 RepID=A0A834K8V7_VESGE|nr:hypothetical protein HZH68_008088 [Vespula germanica]
MKEEKNKKEKKKKEEEKKKKEKTEEAASRSGDLWTRGCTRSRKKDSVWQTIKRLRGQCYRISTAFPSNPDLLSAPTLSPMEFFLISNEKD